MNDYLKLQGIRKHFGQAPVLDGVDLSVSEGELVTLLGPSGCGKSTLLRCIAGLTELDSGSIVLAGRDMTGLPPRSRDVGMVFQSYALFPNLTVSQNVEYGMRMRGVAPAARRARSAELLAMVDLEDKRDVHPQSLSGGQQQRVALARSLAVQPKLLLLDEPLSALDARIRKNLRAEIRDIQRRLGMTTLFVTHDQEEALIMSDRICIMNQGRMVQEGSPEQLYTAPRTEFAARFMGSYNVLSRAEALALFRRIESRADRFAIRPESVTLLAAGERVQDDADGLIDVHGEVQAVSVLGSIIRATVVAEGIALTVDLLNDGRWLRVREGDRVTLLLDPAQLLHLEQEGA
ncbi:ATP-binding cassette domain-containing protein [Paenibacillus sp. MMS20-IR301]|uniref:ABC transporter ATP-binding protein n=1 Tax=Paenibacillus sp. MMS20-IR301 TaxID=2895946 RepID=UPI0028EDF2E5|nr:ATP-binding cassette domain-containing protein [Paenibacillus sp. MMS20-IR301]WNS41918.1 ATP-binding cassette domain-containing protein [Paenibacillus sp. MMS20-IR301]